MKRLLLTVITGIATGIGSGIADHLTDGTKHYSEFFEHAPIGGVGLVCGAVIAFAIVQERKTK